MPYPHFSSFCLILSHHLTPPLHHRHRHHHTQIPLLQSRTNHSFLFTLSTHPVPTSNNKYLPIYTTPPKSIPSHPLHSYTPSLFPKTQHRTHPSTTPETKSPKEPKISSDVPHRSDMTPRTKLIRTIGLLLLFVFREKRLAGM